MALKTVTIKVVPAFFRSPGEEVQPGDEATLTLDQSRNPDLPATIPATVLTVSDVIVHEGGCGQNGKSYIFQYDTADLDGAVLSIAACDVLTASGTSCCEALRADLDELVEEVENISDDLDTLDMAVFSGEPVNGSPGVQQQETQTAVGTVATDGTLVLTVTGVGITGSPLAIPFNVDAGDIPAVWAAKAAAALAGNAAVTALYTATSLGANFGLKEIVPNGNDGTLNIAVTNGTATGITPSASSLNTTTGVAALAAVPPPARVGQFGKFGNRVWVATSLYEWVEDLTEYSGVNYAPGITLFTGGTAAALDSLVMTSADIGRLQATEVAGVLYFHELIAGINAEAAPNIVRPDNYAGGTNEVVWQWRFAATKSAGVLDATTGGVGNADSGLLVKFGPSGDLAAFAYIGIGDASGSGFFATVAPETLTAARGHLFPDADGVIALRRTVTSSSPGTGATTNVARYVDQFFDLTPGGTIAAHAFVLPSAANSRVGQKVELMSSQVITALTVSVSGGGTVSGAALTAAAVNTSYEWICTSVASSGTWKRIR